LLETALALPLLLALLAGGYWVCADLFLSGAAESAAHAHLLRSGRGQPGIEGPLAATVLPRGEGVEWSGGNRPLAGGYPLFPGLSGRTAASLRYTLHRGDVGGYSDLPPHRGSRGREATVDCWGGNTPSGKKVRRFIQGILLTGALR
jgi:hypothetical protein